MDLVAENSEDAEGVVAPPVVIAFAKEPLAVGGNCVKGGDGDGDGGAVDNEMDPVTEKSKLA